MVMRWNGSISKLIFFFPFKNKYVFNFDVFIFFNVDNKPSYFLHALSKARQRFLSPLDATEIKPTDALDLKLRLKNIHVHSFSSFTIFLNKFITF